MLDVKEYPDKGIGVGRKKKKPTYGVMTRTSAYPPDTGFLNSRTIQRLRDQSNDRPDQLRLANEIITTSSPWGQNFKKFMEKINNYSHYSG